MADQALSECDLLGEVDFDDVAIDLHLGLERGAALRDAGVGDRNVDAALPGDRLPRRVRQRRILAHVEGEDERLRPKVAGDRG